MGVPIKFDKQLRDTQGGFMSLRKRSQSHYDNVTCEAENSLSSGMLFLLISPTILFTSLAIDFLDFVFIQFIPKYFPC